MPSVTYVEADGEKTQFGNFADLNNAVIFHDDSGNSLVIATLAGETIAFEVGTSRRGAWTNATLTVVGGVNLSSPTGTGLGYSTGAGGAVTQLTNRTTGVTLNTLTGTITTSSASLAAEATADFVVTNSTVAIGDTIILSVQSGSNGGGTLVAVITVAAGSFTIRVHNGNVAAGTAETGAILINFAVIKAVSA